MPHSNTGIKTTHITDATGNLIAEYSYDAWGRMRDPETLQYPSEDAATPGTNILRTSA